MKKLYLLTVSKGQSFYVIATNPTEAETNLMTELNRADWYFANDRIVTEIKLLAEEVHEFNGRLAFGNKIGDLLICV